MKIILMSANVVYSLARKFYCFCISAFGLSNMDNPLPAVPKDVKILETAEDIQERREQVLSRYSEFKSEARTKREKLEDSRRFQVRFKISVFYSY